MPLALGDSWKRLPHRRRRQGIPRALRRRGSLPAGSSAKTWKRCSAQRSPRAPASASARTFTGAHGISGEGDEHGERAVPRGRRAGEDRLGARSPGADQHRERVGGASRARRQGEGTGSHRCSRAIRVAARRGDAAAQINCASELQAASPAYETARLFRMIGIGVEALRGFAAVLIARRRVVGVHRALFRAGRAPLRSRRHARARRSPRAPVRPADDRRRGACLRGRAARPRCSVTPSPPCSAGGSSTSSIPASPAWNGGGKSSGCWRRPLR